MLLRIVIASLLLATIVSADGDANVVVLTDDNFDAELAKIPIALVEFYAPWCGHCKNLEPKWNEAADKIAETKELDGVRLCKIDADGQKKAAGSYRVSGFPSIKLFRMGQFVEDFEGERTVEGIIGFLKDRNNVVLNKEITSSAELKKVTKNAERTTIVGFFSDKSSVDYKYFAQVVMQFAGNGIDAYHTSSAAVLEAFGFFGSGSSIVMYRPNAKPNKVTYRGTIFKQQLKDWVIENAVPSVGVYSKQSEALYKLSMVPLVRYVSEDGKAPAGLLEGLAKKFPKVKFASSVISEYKADVEAQCEPGVKACLLGHEAPRKGAKVFGSTGSITESAAELFVNNLLSKKLSVRVKSEAAGPEPQAGSVAVVVGSTFKSIVGDDSKNVFIEFYAPWCGHCKNLAPKYDELAKELSDEFDSLVIAKMDLTNNDIPEEFKSAYPVQGFPTLFLAPKGKKTTPVLFEGNRDVDGMKSWLKEKAV